MRLKSKILVESGDCSSAKPYLDSCIALNPDDGVLHFWRAHCLVGEKLLKEAVSDLDQAIRLAGLDSCNMITKAYELRGHAKRYLEDYRAAYQDFDSAYETAKSCPEWGEVDTLHFLVNLGGIASAFDPSLGDSLAGAIVAQFPWQATGYRLRAGILQSQSMFADAKSEYDEVIARFSGDASIGQVHFDRAACFVGLNQLDSACADWQRALELGSADAQAKLDSFCWGRE